MSDKPIEIRVGAKPPGFSLPQIGTDQTCGPENFQGLPTVLFMWASW